MSRRNNPDMFGITRIDQPENGTRCWWVRLHRIGSRRVQRSFPDGRYGGPGKSFAAAVKFRDEQRKLQEPKKAWGTVSERRAG